MDRLSNRQRVRRTLMFTPGSARERLFKITALPADSFLFDLEDGVAANAKAQARSNIAAALLSLDFAGRERVVRVNRAGSKEFDADMHALPFAHLDTLLIPKVESVADVHRVDAMLEAEEARAHLPVRSIGLMMTLETPRALLNALAIAEASTRCCALFFGAGDYAATTDCALTPDALLWARSTVVAAAKAAGCDAIDTPFFDIRNVEGTYADAILGRQLGFTGKGAFHPLQIEPIHRAMTPTPAEVERARRVIAAFADMSSRGEGIALVDGELVAIDLLPRMERVLNVHAHASTHRL